MDQQTSPPPINDSIGPKNLYIITPVLALGILFYSVRIYTRVVPTYKLNSSDYTNSVAVLGYILRIQYEQEKIKREKYFG